MPNKIVYATKKGTISTNRKRQKGKKRPLNRYEAEADLSGVSASAKKLKNATPRDASVDPTFTYCFITFVSVFSQISEHIVCSICHSKVQFQQTCKRGLGFKIDIVCLSCAKKDGNKVIASVPSSPFIRNAYDINRRIILAMRLIGVGLNGLSKFCAFMDIPRPLFQSYYDSIVKTISVATASVREVSMKRAAEEEIKLSAEKGQADGITVSGDGTWRKRGFSSLFGVVTLIGWITGKVIDIVVKSSYCKSCEYWKKKEGTEKHAEWLETHEDDCQANHQGSAGKMEVDAAKEMFGRSITLHGKPYVNYVGDGDCKTHKGVVESEDLSRDELLSRCLGSYTQNSNESFNALLWTMAPKHISSGCNILNICSDLAVCIFNDGISSVMDVMDVLDLTIGENCYNYCLEVDHKRVEYSERSLTDAAREARLSLKSSRREEEQGNANLEGEIYGAGIAD